jgi:hypothetical protein
MNIAKHESDATPTSNPAAETRTLRVISTLAVPGQPTGSVVHDDRGNATWRIHAAPGASLETSTVVLRALDTRELAVEGIARRSLAGYDEFGGYNPYDRVGRDCLSKTASARAR